MIVFSDEIYEKLVYDGLKFVSFATLHPSLLERTLTFNCHSKSFAMTGWRIGYIGGPEAGHRRDQQAAEPDDQPHHQLHPDARRDGADRPARRRERSSRCASSSRSAAGTCGSG